MAKRLDRRPTDWIGLGIGALVLVGIIGATIWRVHQTGVDNKVIAAAAESNLEEVRRLLKTSRPSAAGKAEAAVRSIGATQSPQSLEIVRLLLDNGVSPNAKGQSLSLLEAAVQAGDDSCLKLLLERGADVKKHVENGVTLLTVAVNNNHFGSLALLLEKGADPNAADGYDAPLVRAIQQGRVDAVKVLLDHGANPNHVSQSNKQTPLILAVNIKNNEVIRLLLKKKVDMEARDGFGLTALQWAEKINATDIATLLRDAGAK